MSKIFVGSDFHFDHKNIIHLCGRPFKSVEEMNEVLLRNINEVVGPDDTFYILGDFCWRFDLGWGILDKINCNNIHFIYGNHDPDPTDKRIRFYNHPKIKSHQQYLEISYKGTKFVMFHYPIESWNGMHKKWVNIYAHVHKDLGPHPVGLRAHAGVDSNNFRPVDLDFLLASFSSNLL